METNVDILVEIRGGSEVVVTVTVGSAVDEIEVVTVLIDRLDVCAAAALGWEAGWKLVVETSNIGKIAYQSFDEECRGDTYHQNYTDNPCCNTPSRTAAAGSKHMRCF